MSSPNTSKAKHKANVFWFNKARIRIIILALLFLIEIGAVVALIIFTYVYDLPWLNFIYVLAEIFSIIVAIPIVNSRMDPAYKVTWLVFMLINSVIGATFYLLFGNKKFSKREKKKIKPSLTSLEGAMNSPEANGIASKLKPEDGDLYNFATYIKGRSYTDTYSNTKTTYFAWGEEAFPVMLEKLRQAKHYIFLEYFIIQPGLFWNSILAILEEKAKRGVDVRVIYDDLGCLSTLPPNYDIELKKKGIHTVKYAPLRTLFNIRMNNRDHRKIMVIDGHTGFTGGINLADEYINEIVRFGKWKDTAIMLEGDGVFGLTNLFLSTWVRLNNLTTHINFKNYLPARYISEAPLAKGSGYVAPYGSIPYTYETVGLNIYTMLCYRAKKYLDISTPYLVLNKEMEEAISQAAKNGVRVRLCTPAIPDKKIVFELTRSYYRNLLKSGVEIYEYTPGFVHQKMFLVDGNMATVGTINLDYRSLFLHAENGCFLYGCECIADIKKDFDNTFRVSKQITLEEYFKTSRIKRLFRAILRIFAPLM